MRLILSQSRAGVLGMAKVTAPICMAFTNGVSSDQAAYPLNATDVANNIAAIFGNGNGKQLLYLQTDFIFSVVSNDVFIFCVPC